MNDLEKLVVCMGKGVKEEDAATLAKRLNAPLKQEEGEQLTLLVEADGLSLTGYGMRFREDFEKMLYRISRGRLFHEMLIHAAKTQKQNPTAIDATAGMGEDSLLLAAYGYDVTMYEQNPVIAALLRDAMKRAENHPVLGEMICRMHLIEGNSIEHLQKSREKKDLIYLDPMFPSRKKSGLIHKKLQLIQKLEQPCIEEESLLEAAFLAEPGKIIIKRPLKGAFLAGRKPGYSIKGKAIRYDCFHIWPGC